MRSSLRHPPVVHVYCRREVFDQPGEFRDVESVSATCTRCGAQSTAFGTSNESDARALAALRGLCRLGESNFYTFDESAKRAVAGGRTLCGCIAGRFQRDGSGEAICDACRGVVRLNALAKRVQPARAIQPASTAPKELPPLRVRSPDPVDCVEVAAALVEEALRSADRAVGATTGHGYLAIKNQRFMRDEDVRKGAAYLLKVGHVIERHPAVFELVEPRPAMAASPVDVAAFLAALNDTHPRAHPGERAVGVSNDAELRKAGEMAGLDDQRTSRVLFRLAMEGKILLRGDHYEVSRS